jgi:hypothetical protein
MTERQLIAKLVQYAANMEGGVSYTELRDMPLRELEIVADQINKIVSAQNTANKRAAR